LIALPLYVVHTPVGASSRTVSPLAKRSPVTVNVCAVPLAVGLPGDSERMREALGLLGLLGELGLASSEHAVVSPSPTTSALVASNFFRESINIYSSPRQRRCLSCNRWLDRTAFPGAGCVPNGTPGIAKVVATFLSHRVQLIRIAQMQAHRDLLAASARLGPSERRRVSRPN
jgi:hypothetical protein